MEQEEAKGNILGNLTFKIPFLPPSMNSMYNVLYNLKRIELKPEARMFKTKAKQFIPGCDWIQAGTGKLALHMDFKANWYFKNENFRKLDVQNLTKLVVDTVAERFGIDDSQLWEVTARKVQHSMIQEIGVTLSKWES